MKSDATQNATAWLDRQSLEAVKSLKEKVFASGSTWGMGGMTDEEIAAVFSGLLIENLSALVQAAHDVNIKLSPIFMRARNTASVSREQIQSLLAKLSRALLPIK